MPPFRIAPLAALAAAVLVAADEPKLPTPKFKLDKETTFVTGPLDRDGYVDYETALNERLKGTATPDTNAVVLLLKCFGPKPEGAELHPDFYKWLGAQTPPENGDYLVSGGKWFAEEYRGENADAFNKLETRLRQQPWKPDDSPKHAEWLTANAKPLAVAAEASRRPEYFHPLVARNKDGSRGQLLGALLPMVQKNREVAALLSFRVTRHLGEGKVDEAFADALTMHRLARLAGRGATLIELLVGIAIDAIAHNSEVAIFGHGKPTARQALAYQAALLKLPPMPTVRDKIRLGERFWSLDAVQSMPKTGFDGAKEWLDKTPDDVLKSLDFELMMRRMNRWYDKVDAALEKPTPWERKAAADAFEKELLEVTRKTRTMTPLQKFFLMAEEPEARRAKVSEQVASTLVGLLMPAFQKVSEASVRGEQMHRNGVVAAGLAAHLADAGKYPDKLADLVPKYLPKEPEDAFSGKPLTYRKSDAGYLLYSVGANGKDDGGNLLTDEPRGDDVGVRLPRK